MATTSARARGATLIICLKVALGVGVGYGDLFGLFAFDRSLSGVLKGCRVMYSKFGAMCTCQ